MSRKPPETAAAAPAEETLALLRSYPHFASLSPERLTRLADLLHPVRFAAGTPLFRQGDRGETMFFLCRGKVRFLVEDRGGRPVELETVGPGSFFGEVALFGDLPRSADAEAIEETVALELHRRGTGAFLDGMPDLAEVLLRGMADRLARSSHRLRGSYVSLVEAVAQDQSPLDRWTDWIVPRFANWWFLIVNFGLAAYLRFYTEINADDLGLILSLEALAITVLVLNSQNRDERDMRIRDRVVDERMRQISEEVEHVAAEVRRLRPYS